MVAAWLVTRPRRRATLGAGLGAMGAAFALSTPFFFLDPREALHSIGGETGSPDPGRSSGFVGNLAFYSLHAIPGALSWIGLAAGLGGFVLALRHRTPGKRLLLVWIATLVLGISVLPFHWDRWLIPALPVLVLFAVDALVELARHVARLTARRAHWRSGVTFAAVLGASLVLTAVGPADALVHLEQTEARPSTRTVAQSWIERHVTHGSGVAVEVQGPVLPTTEYRTVEHHSLPNAGSVGEYARAGYRYLVLDAGLDRTYLDRRAAVPGRGGLLPVRAGARARRGRLPPEPSPPRPSSHRLRHRGRRDPGRHGGHRRAPRRAGGARPAARARRIHRWPDPRRAGAIAAFAATRGAEPSASSRVSRRAVVGGK